jgi:hypothetical protein
MYTRRHFIGIARLLGSIKAKADIAESFIDYFKTLNPAFSETKFHQEIDEYWGKEFEFPYN